MTTNNNCSGAENDLTYRISQLTARIYTHQNMIDQYMQERERLQCILDNLNNDDSSAGSDSEGDGDAPVSSGPVITVGSPTALAHDGPWQ